MKIWTGKRHIDIPFSLFERLTFVSTAIKHQDREVIEDPARFLELGRGIDTDGFVSAIELILEETEIQKIFDRDEMDSYFYVLAFKHPNQEEVDILRFFFMGIQ